MTNQAHTLIAVLDWGLGHASRCVPLINSLQKNHHKVTVASSGSALAFLKASIDADHFLELPPYAVRYPTSSMVWNMGLQSARLWRVMRAEHQLVAAYLKEEKVDGIVSDGRFGCWHPGVKSIWLAHQLQIQHPFSPLRWGMNTLYHQFIKRCFEEVWIPDFQGEKSLAGALATPITGLAHCYVEPLSRFAKSAITSTQRNKYEWLALLSGPEPQRTYLEEELKRCLLKLDVPALIVRGVAGDTTIRPISQQVSTVDWLLGDELLKAVRQSEKLIARSGYSTLMDAHYWQKPLLLVPTPGQTEQEYLAKYWAEKGWASWQRQGEVVLEKF